MEDNISTLGEVLAYFPDLTSTAGISFQAYFLQPSSSENQITTKKVELLLLANYCRPAWPKPFLFLTGALDYCFLSELDQ